jgi:N-acetylmuramic acid 6-phosphate etherase
VTTGSRNVSPTEARNPRTLGIDAVPTIEVLRMLNAEDHLVAPAVERVLAELARAVDAVVEALRGAGRVHYVGAGTSGRLAVLDAAELTPTFGLEPGRVVAHLAGGRAAFQCAVEGAEDDAGALAGLRSADVVVGLAASGRTPYVAGALGAARAAGATTVLVDADPASPLAAFADIHVSVETGAEAIAGSTRLKAGTAQKLVLNALSTAAMVRLGKTYSNLMVDLVATNVKLRGRLITILVEATGAPEARCVCALRDADGELKVALAALLSGAPVARARAALRAENGYVRRALEYLSAQ